MTSFPDARTLSPAPRASASNAWTADVPPGWAQGRAAFGGLLAALGIDACAKAIAPDRALRSVLVSFVAPAAPGPLDVTAAILREGRAMTQAEARLSQDGELRAIVQGVWGAPRRSPIAVAGASRPAGPPPDELAPFPFIEGVTPTFTRNFEYRWIGPVPFSGARVPEVSGWIRHRAISRVDAGAVLAMLDAWPLPVLSLLRAPAAASTVTWMVDLVGPIAPDPAGWWRYASSTEQAGDGYVDMRARLWGPDGVLVATSSQLGAEFAPVEAP